MFSGHTLRPTGTSRAHHARLAFKISISFYKTIYSDEYVHLKLTVFTDTNDDVARMQYANQSVVVNFHSFLCLLHHLPYYFFFAFNCQSAFVRAQSPNFFIAYTCVVPTITFQSPSRQAAKPSIHHHTSPVVKLLVFCVCSRRVYHTNLKQMKPLNK